MAYTIEKILNDAHNLSMRLKEHDITADSLITRTQTLQRQVEAMKQYQENLNELNEIARHRPRANLIFSLAQENSQIREMQQENKELRESLEEHQTALELIMSKYREQVSKLLKADQLERAFIAKKLDRSQELQEKLEKIYEMAAVMWKAIKIDDESVDEDEEIIIQLQKENESMRQLLQISSSSCAHLTSSSSSCLEDKDTQTDDDQMESFDQDVSDYENHMMSSLEVSWTESPSIIVAGPQEENSVDEDEAINRSICKTTPASAAKTTPAAAAAAAAAAALNEIGEQADVTAIFQFLDGM